MTRSSSLVPAPLAQLPWRVILLVTAVLVALVGVLLIIKGVIGLLVSGG